MPVKSAHLHVLDLTVPSARQRARMLAPCSVTLAGAHVTLLCCLVLFIVLPFVVWVKRRDSVQHSI